jgi:hypothetical protein
MSMRYLNVGSLSLMIIRSHDQVVSTKVNVLWSELSEVIGRVPPVRNLFTETQTRSRSTPSHMC